MTVDNFLYRLATFIHQDNSAGDICHRVGTIKSIVKHFKKGKFVRTSLHFDRSVEPRLGGLDSFSTPLDVPFELIGRKVRASESYHCSIGPFYYKGYVVNECKNDNSLGMATVQRQWEFGKYFDTENNPYELYIRFIEENKQKSAEGGLGKS